MREADVCEWPRAGVWPNLTRGRSNRRIKPFRQVHLLHAVGRAWNGDPHNCRSRGAPTCLNHDGLSHGKRERYAGGARGCLTSFPYPEHIRPAKS